MCEAMQKVIAIVGPTASGKSDLAVQLAQRLNGEIISADSRQVYKGMDIGSGKITKKEMRSIPHHLLDVASPRRKFTVYQYKTLALKAIKQIHAKGKLPILVGGTPFYIYSIVDNYIFPEVKPNLKLRSQLEKLSIEELLFRLQKLDPERASSIEQKNKRRLIRALEIVITTDQPVPQLHKANPLFDVLILGIRKSPEELKKRIRKRLLKRLEEGMIEEVEKLHRGGLSWKRLEEFGLEYRFIAQYLQQKISYKEMVQILEKAINDFARRQMVWFKKDSRVHWLTDISGAKDLMKQFLLK